MRKKKVCILWHCPYPWDIRIEKFCRAISTAGYEVSIVCRGKQGSPATEKIEDFTVYRVLPPRWFAKDIATMPLFFNPNWTISARRLVKSIKPDLLIVRDIPLGLLAGKIARESGIPAMLDMAENYPAALLAYNNKLYNPFLFSNAKLARIYEKKCLDLMSHTIVVSNEQESRMRAFGVPAKKVSVVMNTPDLEHYSELSASSAEAQRRGPDEKLKLVYVGKIDAHRGIDTLIKGIAAAVKTAPSISLTVVGSGTEIENMKGLAASLGVTGNIDFAGWVTFTKIPSVIKESHIGIIPHNKSEHTDTTIPNKLFDYMSFAKPVVSSDINPVAAIINKVRCGKVFKNADPESLAGVLVELAKKGNLAALGQNGFEAVKTRYNWAVDRGKLIKCISNLI